MKIFGEIFFDWIIMGGDTIVLRSLKIKQNEKKFQDRPTFFYLCIIYDPPKIRSIDSDRDGFMCKSWAKMSNFIPLVSD
jgi:hypothetical protein